MDNFQLAEELVMKNVIISADGDRMVYSVPDIVANNLAQYCIEFCGRWLRTSPHARKYRRSGGVCFNEAAFIEYLNKWIFPEQRSKLIENLGPMGVGESPIPEQYRDCPTFNF